MGASLFIIIHRTYITAWTGTQPPPIKEFNVRLCNKMGERIPVDGAIKVDVIYLDQKAHLSLVVDLENGRSLMGRGWICHIRQDCILPTIGKGC